MNRLDSIKSTLLLGPGPSNAHPDVLSAISLSPIGHLDPFYVDLMGEVQELLRQQFHYQLIHSHGLMKMVTEYSQ